MHWTPIVIPPFKVGRLTRVKFAGMCNDKSYWYYTCQCGKIVCKRGAVIKYVTRSCGCLQIETIKKQSTVHGDLKNGQKSPEYTAWTGMWQRTTNPNATGYKDYGGRGITVCERWSKYQNFIKDMGRRPSPKYSLDRINNDGNYEPNNCRWATKKEQQSNRRITKSC